MGNLFKLIKANNFSEVEHILKNGSVDINKNNREGFTPLNLAISQSNLDVDLKIFSN